MIARILIANRDNLDAMLLLTGPPGSGKTTRILDQFRDALRRHDWGVRLLTPTATMAQHLQNQLAREGFVFRPRLIQTLSQFVDSTTPELPQVSEPLLRIIVEAAAARVNRLEFARVSNLPGFCAALARTIEEFSAAGCDAGLLGAQLPLLRATAPLGEAFAAVYREVDGELSRRGLATRSKRLAAGAERIKREGLTGIHSVWMDGFHALPDPELAVIAAIGRHAAVTLTLPDHPATRPTRNRLLAMGFSEERATHDPLQPAAQVCTAPSLEREADEIARRILAESAAGRPFRDIGVVVRTPAVYEPILRVTFDRFGIPARFYFDADLTDHSLIRCLSRIVDAMLGGWDFADTLSAIRLVPTLASDEFAFALQARIPGRGMAAMRHIASEISEPVASLLSALEAMESWRFASDRPAEWAARLKDLCRFGQPPCPEPEMADSSAISRGQAAV